jgi:hypothetical protein
MWLFKGLGKDSRSLKLVGLRFGKGEEIGEGLEEGLGEAIGVPIGR